MNHRTAGLGRKWIGPVPVNRDGSPVPKDQWARRRRFKWAVRWFALTATGKRHQSKVFPGTPDGKRSALEFQKAKQAEIDRAGGTVNATERVTVGRFIDDYKRLQRNKATSVAMVVGSLRKLALYVGGDDVRLDRITIREASGFVASLSDQYPRRTTINRHIRALKSAFSWACGMEYLRDNPFCKVKLFKTDDPKPRFVTRDEFAAILTACPDLWWRTFVSVAFTTGARFNELVNLTWRDIDFAENRIRVTPKVGGDGLLPWSPKSGKSREVPVPADGAPLSLLAELQAESNGSPYVFVGVDRVDAILDAQAAGTWKGTREVLWGVQKRFASIVVKASKTVPSLVRKTGDADKPKIRPTVKLHDLRKTYATNMAAIVPAQVCRDLLGHADISTTMKFYATTTAEQLDRVAAAAARLVADVGEPVGNDPNTGREDETVEAVTR